MPRIIPHNIQHALGQQVRHASGTAKPPVLLNDAEAKALLGRFFNLAHLQKVVENGRAAIQPRTAKERVPEAGLLAIAAYTSAGLDRMIHETYFSGGGPADRRDAVKALEGLIQGTLPTIALTKFDVVKRNMTMDPSEVRTLYRPGALISFERITSVTLQPHQVYRGGNLDLTIKPYLGVVNVSTLSTFSGSHDRAEREGMLDPGGVYEVTHMESGREDSPLDAGNKQKSLHSENWKIVLREIGPS